MKITDIDMDPAVVCLRLRSILTRAAGQSESEPFVSIRIGPQDVHAIGLSERVIRRMFIPESEAFHSQHDVSADPE